MAPQAKPLCYTDLYRNSQLNQGLRIPLSLTWTPKQYEKLKTKFTGMNANLNLQMTTDSKGANIDHPTTLQSGQNLIPWRTRMKYPVRESLTSRPPS